MLERISYRQWENAYRISNASVELVNSSSCDSNRIPKVAFKSR